MAALYSTKKFRSFAGIFASFYFRGEQPSSDVEGKANEFHEDLHKGLNIDVWTGGTKDRIFVESEEHDIDNANEQEWNAKKRTPDDYLVSVVYVSNMHDHVEYDEADENRADKEYACSSFAIRLGIF
jgi:hypothetical protein